MSRASPNPAPNPAALPEPTRGQQPDRLSYSENPNIKGMSSAVKRIKELFGVEVTEYYLRRTCFRPITPST
jgi:hypothetical protein